MSPHYRQLGAQHCTKRRCGETATGKRLLRVGQMGLELISAPNGDQDPCGKDEKVLRTGFRGDRVDGRVNGGVFRLNE